MRKGRRAEPEGAGRKALCTASVAPAALPAGRTDWILLPREDVGVSAEPSRTGLGSQSTRVRDSVLDFVDKTQTTHLLSVLE